MRQNSLKKNEVWFSQIAHLSCCALIQDEYERRYADGASSGGGDSLTGLEIDPGCLFRHGHTPSGRPTITPRLLAFDLTGALGAMPDAGYLNAPPKAEAARAQLQSRWYVFQMKTICTHDSLFFIFSTTS